MGDVKTLGLTRADDANFFLIFLIFVSTLPDDARKSAIFVNTPSITSKGVWWKGGVRLSEIKLAPKEAGRDQHFRARPSVL